MRTALLLVAVTALALHLSAPARAAGSRPAGGPATVSVHGEASGRFAPDTAALEVTVVSTAPAAGKAAAVNAGRAEALLDAIKRFIDPEDTAETRTYSLRPVYDREDRVKPGAYRAENSLVIRTRDTGKVGRLIDLATENGADRIGAVGFFLEETSDECAGLIEEASEKARATAGAAARAFGLRLGRVTSLRPACSAGGPPMLAATHIREAASATPVAPKRVEVRATVEAEFELTE